MSGVMRSGVGQPTLRPIAAATAAAALFAVAQAAAPSSAQAAADYFAKQGCPVSYRAETASKYTNAKKRSYNKALKQWKFDDVRGKKIKPPVNWRKLGKSKADRSKLHSLKFLDRLYGIADRRKLKTTKGYPKSAERRALRNAVKIAADWARAAARNKVGSDAWKQRIAGVRAPYLFYGARRAACKGSLSNKDAAAIKKVVRRHAKLLARKPSKFTPENHKFSINTGLAAMGAYFPKDRFVRKKANKAGARFVATIAKGYNKKEGTWLEQSPRYQLLSYRLLDNYLKRIDPGSKPVKRVAKRLLSTLGRFLLPNHRLVTWGDTSGEEFFDQDLIKARKSGWWVAFQSGVAIFSSASSWFGTTVQYHARQHKQPDELTFDLWESGRYLIRDTGFFHKNNSQMGRFQKTSRAHSVLTVNNRDFNWSLHQKPYGSGILAAGRGDGWYAVRGKNPLLIAPKGLTKAQKKHSRKFRNKVKKRLKKAAKLNTEHTRTFLYKPGEALIVADVTRSKRERTYNRYFQFGADTTVDAPRAGELSFGFGKTAGKMLTGSTAPFTVSVRSGQAKPTLGYEFPEAEKRLPRGTAIVSTRAANLGQLTGLFYGPDVSRIGSIRAVGPLDGNQLIEILDTQGNVIKTLDVTRRKKSMTVAES